MQPSKLAESGCKHDVTKKFMHAPKTANAYDIWFTTEPKQNYDLYFFHVIDSF